MILYSKERWKNTLFEYLNRKEKSFEILEVCDLENESFYHMFKCQVIILRRYQNIRKLILKIYSPNVPRKVTCVVFKASISNYYRFKMRVTGDLLGLKGISKYFTFVYLLAYLFNWTKKQ